MAYTDPFKKFYFLQRIDFVNSVLYYGGNTKLSQRNTQMQINLSQEIDDHLKRVKDLAEEAAEDSDQSFSSRAAAMAAFTNMLTNLTKSQEAIYTIEELIKTEQTIIRIVKQYLNQHQLNEVATLIEEELNKQ